jgi:hypothetical protein
VQLGVGHHVVQEMMESYDFPITKFVPEASHCMSDLADNSKEGMAGNCSPIHPTVQIWPSKTTTCLGPWKFT